MFYVNVDTKKFTTSTGKPPAGGNADSCGCKDKPVFLNYSRGPFTHESIVKPQLTQLQVTEIPIKFLHSDGTPFDLTQKTLLLAVDNDFRHDNDLIAICRQGTIVNAAEGQAVFAVQGNSSKFHKVVQSKIPASSVYAQIVCYPYGSTDGVAILQDSGIKLHQRIYSDEGQPQQDESNYYTKSQINSLLKNIKPSGSNSSAGTILNGDSAPDPLYGTPGDFYIDTKNKGLYLKGLDDWNFLGYLASQLGQMQYDYIQ